MSILQRANEILKSNINDLLDKCEDPEKIIKQQLRDLKEKLEKEKQETAVVIANERMAKDKLDDCVNEINKYQKIAEKALAKGNEDDAREAISKKQKAEGKKASLETAYNASHETAETMRKVHAKLVSDISTLEGRMDGILAEVAAAKAQESANKIVSGTDTSGSVQAFERMEEKAKKRLEAARAVAELNEHESGKDDLEEKYLGGGESSVEDELAAMKLKMGIQ